MNNHRRFRLVGFPHLSPNLVVVIRIWTIAVVASFVLFFCHQGTVQAAPASAPHATLVSGDINVDTTWTPAGNPYEVTNMLRVVTGVTLTIEPGVQVIVAQQTYIIINGSLVAEGTEASPITFSGTTPQSGWWYGISVDDSQEEPASVTFDYVTIQHTGYNNAYNGGALEIRDASASINHSTFQNNGSNGLISFLSGPLQITDSSFINNGLHAIRLENGPFDPQFSNLTATGSGTEGEGYDAVVYVTIIWETGDHILEKMGLPYVFKQRFTVEPEARLIMQPGIEIQVDAGFSFGIYVNGALSAIGTAAQPILITGLDKQPGSWEGLEIAGAFGAHAIADLDYVTLEYGGLTNSSREANLSVYLAHVTVRNSIIRNGGKNGIYNSGGAPDELPSLLVENTTFTNNADTAIVCDDESCNQTLSNLIATGNGLDAMRQHFTLSGKVIWSDAGLPYVVDVFTGINEGGMMIIEPGVEVRMTENAHFNVDGTLFAVGTPEKPILFTGTQQEPGWWENIQVRAGGFLELRYCDVGYGGASNAGMLQFSTGAGFVSNCRLHDSSEAAIRTYLNATPVVTYNLIEQNVAGIINGTNSAFPLTLDARNNWWGSPSGPTHPSNPGGTGNSVSDLVLYDPWLQSADEATNPDTLLVQISGVGRYSPGETVQYAIAYFNPTEELVEDAVLRVALPANSKYIDSIGGGIFWPERGQMFWKLGDLAPGAAGLLTVRVTYDWGLPDGLKTAIVAQLGGRGTDETLFDVEGYLAYTPRFETTVSDLTKAQVQTLRAGDADMDAIYDQAEADGYVYGSATQRTYTTGQQLTQVILLKVVDEDIQAFILWRQESGSVGMAVDGLGLTVYKPGRGLRYSLQTKLWQEIDPSLLAATQALSWSDCMKNCIAEKLPGEIAEQVVKAYGVSKKVLGCIQALTGDDDGTLECSKIIEKAIPGYGVGVELGTCNVDCKACEASGGECTNDQCHCCTADKLSCSSNDWVYGTLGIDVIKRQECKDGKYKPEVVESVCAICEKCVMGAGAPVCVAKTPSSPLLSTNVGALTLTWVDLGVEPVRADLTLVSDSGAQECEECRKAKDPNEITGPTGDLLPGQWVTYTIEYENVGAGEAFGVFIVNPLSDYFDLDTVTVLGGADFILSKPTQRLYFQVGDLAAQGETGSKGQVSYQVRLKTGLPSGTVVVNDAVVHFPSVPEETPTNTAVNTIQPIAVPSQHLQVVAGQPLAITLSGQDVSDSALTFAIVNAPLYGTLTGTPPTLTYTPQANFAGIDRVVFTANNGATTSRLAEVVIEVLPTGSDGVAPTIKWTSPAHGTVVDSSQLLAYLGNGGLYTPYIQIQFSEAMAASTINTTTVQVKNGDGVAVPISVQYDATLDQAVVLMHEQGEAEATYTVTVSTGVKDITGSPLDGNHVWSFRFGLLPVDTPNIYLPFASN